MWCDWFLNLQWDLALVSECLCAWVLLPRVYLGRSLTQLLLLRKLESECHRQSGQRRQISTQTKIFITMTFKRSESHPHPHPTPPLPRAPCQVSGFKTTLCPAELCKLWAGLDEVPYLRWKFLRCLSAVLFYFCLFSGNPGLMHLPQVLLILCGNFTSSLSPSPSLPPSPLPNINLTCSTLTPSLNTSLELHSTWLIAFLPSLNWCYSQVNLCNRSHRQLLAN